MDFTFRLYGLAEAEIRIVEGGRCIMKTGKPVLRFLAWAGVILLQLIMTQVTTFVLSMFASDMETFPQAHPVIFTVFLGVTFTIGVFLVGWLAIQRRWLPLKPRYPARLAATLAGAYVPLILALFLGAIEVGSPFFIISILAAIVGFYLPEWVGK